MILQWQCGLPVIYRPPHFPLHASISFFSLKDFSPLFHHRHDILEDVGIFAVIRFALTKWSTEWPRIYSSFRRSAVPARSFNPFVNGPEWKSLQKGKEKTGEGREKGKIERNGEEEEEEGNNIAHRGII